MSVLQAAGNPLAFPGSSVSYPSHGLYVLPDPTPIFTDIARFMDLVWPLFEHVSFVLPMLNPNVCEDDRL